MNPLIFAIIIFDSLCSCVKRLCLTCTVMNPEADWLSIGEADITFAYCGPGKMLAANYSFVCIASRGSN